MTHAKPGRQTQTPTLSHVKLRRNITVNPGSGKDSQPENQTKSQTYRKSGRTSVSGHIRAKRRHLGSACRGSESEGGSVVRRSHFPPGMSGSFRRAVSTPRLTNDWQCASWGHQPVSHLGVLPRVSKAMFPETKATLGSPLLASISWSISHFSRVWLFATPMDCNSTRLLHLWEPLGRNTGVGCHFLLQESFPTQGSNLGLLHWQADSLPAYWIPRISTKFQTHPLSTVRSRAFSWGWGWLSWAELWPEKGQGILERCWEAPSLGRPHQFSSCSAKAWAINLSSDLAAIWVSLMTMSDSANWNASCCGFWAHETDLLSVTKYSPTKCANCLFWGHCNHIHWDLPAPKRGSQLMCIPH